MVSFLADENYPIASVRRLCSAGNSVCAVVEDSPAANDTQVLSRAAQESLVILTFDRDYGELIYKLRLPAPKGLVYFRFEPENPEEPAEFLLRLLGASDLTLEGFFTVVERLQVRQRALPIG